MYDELKGGWNHLWYILSNHGGKEYVTDGWSVHLYEILQDHIDKVRYYHGDDLSELTDELFYIDHVVPFAYKQEDIVDLLLEIDEATSDREIELYLEEIILLSSYKETDKMRQREVASFIM